MCEEVLGHVERMCDGIQDLKKTKPGYYQLIRDSSVPFSTILSMLAVIYKR